MGFTQKSGNGRPTRAQQGGSTEIMEAIRRLQERIEGLEQNQVTAAEIAALRESVEGLKAHKAAESDVTVEPTAVTEESCVRFGFFRA